LSDRASADVLTDPARFTSRDARLADCIHQRRVAVIDVAHERDDRTAQLEFFLLLDHWRRWGDDHLLDLVHAATFFAAFHLENEAVFLADLGRDLRLDGHVWIREN